MQVCEKCFRDTNLREFIKDNGSQGHCSFCEKNFAPRRTQYACSLEMVAEYIFDCLEVEWTEPHPDYLPYDHEEDEYIGNVYTSLELLQDIAELEGTDFEIYEALESHSPYLQWCSRDGLRDPQSAEFWYTWEQFKYVVMHKSRFYFGRINSTQKDSDIEETYRDISKIVSIAIEYILQLGLIREISPGENIYRARKFKGKIPDKIEEEEMTPPPLKVCSKQSNRMSPAGIPMFYGAFDENTAAKEARGRKNGKTFIATFTATKKLRMLDLVNLQPIPSIFDQHNNRKIELLTFLNSFADDLSKPIKSDGREHTEYVPTQVMTEYVRYFADKSGSLDGVIYRSSVNRGGQSCVIFAEQSDCLESEDDDDNQILSVTQIYKFE